MIDRNAMLSIVDTPVSLRSARQSADLKLYLKAFPEEALVAQKVDAVLTSFRDDMAEEPPPGFDQRLKTRLAANTAQHTSPSNGWLSQLKELFRGNWMLPSLVTVCLLFFVIGLQTQSTSTTRSKGIQIESALHSVDLQIAVESRDPNKPPQAEVDGALLKNGDGILFRMVIQGEGDLVLIERDPSHHLKTIYAQAGIGTGIDPLEISILGKNGSPLRYVPDGPPGEYTYIATLLKPGTTLTDAELDRIWSLWVSGQGGVTQELKIADPLIDGLHLRYEGSQP